MVLADKPFPQQFALIASFVVLLCGMMMYCAHVYFVIDFMQMFPRGTNLDAPVWLTNVIIFIAVIIWIPCIAVIIFKGPDKCLLHIIYIAGCAVAIFFSIGSMSSIDGYRKENVIKNEYIGVVKRWLLAKQFPEDFFKPKCCGWQSPFDIGVVIPLPENLDQRLLTDLSKCYGDAWSVQTVNGQLTLTEKNKDLASLPEGCHQKFKDTVRLHCILILAFGFVVIILSGFFILLSCAVLWSAKRENSRDRSRGSSMVGTVILVRNRSRASNRSRSSNGSRTSNRSLGGLKPSNSAKSLSPVKSKSNQSMRRK